jgi:branched-chain amino acid transport system substrate-binding protein
MRTKNGREGRAWWLRLPILALAAVAATLVLAACSDDDDEPSTGEAQAAFCADLDSLDTALVALGALTAQSSVDDLQSARDDVQSALDDVQSSAADVSDAKIDTLESAYDDLSSAIDDVPGEDTLGEALASLQPQIDAVNAAWDEAYSSADCLNVGGETPAATAEASAEATAPSGTGKTITIAAGDPIKIGVSVTLTTENAELGFPIRDAALMSIEEYGPVNGFTVEAVLADDLCSGPGSEAAAQQLIAENVVAIHGPMCSGGAVAAIDDYATAGLPVVLPSASNASVVKTGATNIARIVWNDDLQGEEMAKYVYNELALTSAVLVDDQSTYGKGLMDVFEASFEELGGTITTRQAVTVGEQDFSSVVTTIGTDSPIVVFGGFIAEGAALVRQLRDAGYEGAYMGADGIADQRFIDLAAGAAEGAYVSRGPQSEPNEGAAFLERYHAKYGPEAGEQFADRSFDAITVLLTAIGEVAEVNSDGDMVIDLDALLAAIKGGTFEGGASGTIKFKEDGDRDIAVGAINEIDQVTDGALVRIQ